MAYDLTWERQARTNAERARTTLGDYIITFSGYDYILAFHPSNGHPPTLVGRYLASGYLKNTAAPEDLEKRHNPQPTPTPATEPTPTVLNPEDPRITTLVQAVADEIDWSDGSNGHAEIMLGITKGLDAAGLYLAPRGDAP